MNLLLNRVQRSQVILKNARKHILATSYLSVPEKAHSIDKSVIFLIFVDAKHSIQI